MVLRILYHSVEMCFRGRYAILRLTYPWLLIMFLVGFLFNKTGTLEVLLDQLRIGQALGFLWLPIVIGFVLNGIAMCVAGHGWLQFLVNEKYPSSFHVRPNQRDVEFAKISLKLLVLLAPVPMITMSARGVMLPIQSGIVIAIYVLLVMPLLTRLAIALPVFAEGKKLSIGQSFKLSKGYGLAMAAAVLIMAVPFLLFDYVMSAVSLNLGTGIPSFFFFMKAGLISTITQFLIMYFFLTVVTVGLEHIRNEGHSTWDLIFIEQADNS